MRIILIVKNRERSFIVTHCFMGTHCCGPFKAFIVTHRFMGTHYKAPFHRVSQVGLRRDFLSLMRITLLNIR
jgi:hypothetical protein